ncbi:phosphotransferase enzyme family protein [Acetobacter sp. DsW_063]|uniref:phosphotransferase enzyme family protein n=1 Tax=Acetobacter sp. DsW_063 TaxID=1514894 RepID=UPI0018E9A47D|nr:phosphotransferase [Acetobacter sp. DsW_063]
MKEKLEPHRSHGLGLEDVAPHWPALEMEDVERLLASYPDAGRPLEIVWRSPRPFSAAAQIRTNRGTVIVKRVHRDVRSPADVEEEHAFIAHLRARGAPVVEVLRDRDGRGAQQRGLWTCEVHRVGKGLDVYRDAPSWTPYCSPAHAHAAGASLGALHRAASGFAHPARCGGMLRADFRLFGDEDPIARIDEDLAARPALARWLGERDWRREITERLLQPFRRRAVAAVRAMQPLWTHGDWHGSNLLWSAEGDDAKVSTIMDFGLSNRSFALFDVATAIERALVSWLDFERGGEPVADLDQLDALLDGYSTTMPRDASLHGLADLLPLAHADFALSEAEYFAGATGNMAHAALAYDGYLLRHADWFDGNEGRRLLRRIAEREGRAA